MISPSKLLGRRSRTCDLSHKAQLFVIDLFGLQDLKSQKAKNNGWKCVVNILQPNVADSLSGFNFRQTSELRWQKKKNINRSKRKTATTATTTTTTATTATSLQQTAIHATETHGRDLEQRRLFLFGTPQRQTSSFLKNNNNDNNNNRNNHHSSSDFCFFPLDLRRFFVRKKNNETRGWLPRRRRLPWWPQCPCSPCPSRPWPPPDEVGLALFWRTKKTRFFENPFQYS